MIEEIMGFHKNISVVYHAVFAALRLSYFFSENNFYKIDVISVKTRCIMTEKQYILKQC